MRNLIFVTILVLLTSDVFASNKNNLVIPSIDNVLDIFSHDQENYEERISGNLKIRELEIDGKDKSGNDCQLWLYSQIGNSETLYSIEIKRYDGDYLGASAFKAPNDRPLVEINTHNEVKFIDSDTITVIAGPRSIGHLKITDSKSQIKISVTNIFKKGPSYNFLTAIDRAVFGVNDTNRYYKGKRSYKSHCSITLKK